MVDTCKHIFAEDVEIGNELDFNDDEYADNEDASYSFARVIYKAEWYSEADEPWITLHTSQGMHHMPAGHVVKIRVDS